jgi:hypothetical protein
MRRCGKRFETQASATRSKKGQRKGAEAYACRDAKCGGWHVKNPPSAPKPAKADRSPSPRGSVKHAVGLVLAFRLPVAQAAALTGADPGSVEAAAWAAVKQLVRDRDSHTCLNCGRPGTDVHHRVRRGMGGTADPLIAFGMANLVTLCRRRCHVLAHKTDDPEMAAKGFRLETRQDPAAEPLTLAGEHGSGAMIWLDPEGGYLMARPDRAGAA